MPNMEKLRAITQLQNNTVQNLTRKTDDWVRFLTLSARFYKYNFFEQALIYAQKPNATACASMDVWNKRIGRYVKRYTKGIALIENKPNGNALKYVYDIADTIPYSNKSVKPPFIWQIKDEHSIELAKKAISSYSRGSSDDLALSLCRAAENVVDDYLDIWLRELDATNSLLENNTNAKQEIRETAVASIEWVLLARCGYDPRQFLDRGSFRFLNDFNTARTVGFLGNIVSLTSEVLLRDIEREIKSDLRRSKYNQAEYVRPIYEPQTKEKAAELSEEQAEQAEPPEETAEEQIEQPELAKWYREYLSFRQQLGLEDFDENNILFYQIGDAYEVYNNDVIKVADILDVDELNIYEKNNGESDIVACAVPLVDADNYIDRIAQSGLNVSVVGYDDNDAERAARILIKTVTPQDIQQAEEKHEEQAEKVQDSLELTIGFSEHPAFYERKDGDFVDRYNHISFAVANRLLAILDERANSDVDDFGYFKTDFQISAVVNGNEFNYDGRYDIGDGDGELIQHIKNYYESQLDPNYPLASAWENPDEERENIRYWLDNFVPFLEQHAELTQEDEKVLEEILSHEDEWFITDVDEQAQSEQAEEHIDIYQEYLALKSENTDRILLYQVGDFFEMYGEDAQNAAQILEIQLTKRTINDTDKIDMCGIPAFSLDNNCELLRQHYDMTISRVDPDTNERQTYYLDKFDKEQSQEQAEETAVNQDESEYYEDL